MRLSTKIGLALCGLYLLAVWRTWWLPENGRLSEADLGVVGAGTVVTVNVLGYLWMVLVAQTRLFLFDVGTPYLQQWCVVAVVSTTLLLGLTQWFLIGRMLGRLVTRRLGQKPEP